MNKFITILIGFIFLFSSYSYIYADHKAPVAFLIQAKGMVEYSKDGKKWKKVRRNKFLFDGYRVRTESDASCRLIEQETNLSRKMGSNSEIVFQNKQPDIINGKLSDPEPAGNLLNGFTRKFQSAQKYTTVRRSVKKSKPKKIKLSTVKEINLSDDYPDLVWENLGPQYSYRLEIGKEIFPVNASEDKYIRYRIEGIKPGQYNFSVKVLKYNKVVFNSRQRTLKWVSNLEQMKIKEQINQIEKIDTGNGFLLGNFFEEQGFLVPAMDNYLNYFENNPDEQEMRIVLIKIYSDLKLKTLKREEVESYMER